MDAAIAQINTVDNVFFIWSPPFVTIQIGLRVYRADRTKTSWNLLFGLTILLPGGMDSGIPNLCQIYINYTHEQNDLPFRLHNLL